MLNYRCIEAFIAVTNSGSISGAADLLSVSQATLSKWISTLEDELETQLIIRRRGRRIIELTQRGKELVPLAQEWLRTGSMILGMKERIVPSVNIAAIDTLNSSVMPDMYRRLLDAVPNLELSVSTERSVAIYSMVERRQCDIGIVAVELKLPNISAVPFMTEPFHAIEYISDVHLCERQSSIDPRSLDIRRNLFMPCGWIHRQWHEYWWKSERSYIWADPVSTLRGLFREDGLWAVVPGGVASQMLKLPNVRELHLSSVPQNRTIYMITHDYPRADFEIVRDVVLAILTDAARDAERNLFLMQNAKCGIIP